MMMGGMCECDCNCNGKLMHAEIGNGSESKDVLSLSETSYFILI